MPIILNEYLNEVGIDEFYAFNILKKFGMIEMQLRYVEEYARNFFLGQNRLGTHQGSGQGFAIM